MSALDREPQSFDGLLRLHLAHEFSESPDLAATCAHMLRSGGKRLRPSLLTTAALAGPDSTAPAVRRAAVAVELFHCATLAHDDVIDDAEVRRGKETVSVRHGATTAALTGGWLFGRSAVIAAECGDSAALRFSAAAARVCDGQMLEVCDLFDSGRTEERYFEAIGGKTAALFELSAALGADLAAAEPALVETAAECGRAFGIAFQILDDVSDLHESAVTTGKRPGKDLLQGVHTLPVIYAVEEAPELHDMLAAGVSADSLPAVLACIRRTTGPARALHGVRTYAELAKSKASALPSGERLEEFVDQVLAAPMARIS